MHRRGHGRADRWDPREGSRSGSDGGQAPRGERAVNLHVDESIYTWMKWFGSFQPDDMRRLKQLTQEANRLETEIEDLQDGKHASVPDADVRSGTGSTRR